MYLLCHHRNHTTITKSKPITKYSTAVTWESETTELSSLMASSTSNRFGLALLRKIAVDRSSALQHHATSTMINPLQCNCNNSAILTIRSQYACSWLADLILGARSREMGMVMVIVNASEIIKSSPWFLAWVIYGFTKASSMFYMLVNAKFGQQKCISQ